MISPSGFMSMLNGMEEKQCPEVVGRPMDSEHSNHPQATPSGAPFQTGMETP